MLEVLEHNHKIIEENRGHFWRTKFADQGACQGIIYEFKSKNRSEAIKSRHLHDDYDEVIVVFDGCYWVEWDGWQRTLCPGEAVFIPSGKAHNSYVKDNLPGSHYLVALFPKELDILSSEDSKAIKLPKGAVQWLIGALFFLRQRPNATSLIPLSSLSSFFKNVKHHKALPHSKEISWLSSQILSLVEQPETPSANELAKLTGVSREKINRSFVQELGCTPLRYGLAWRLDRIKEEIPRGNFRSILDLSTQYGFNDPKYFREQFKRRFGVLPSSLLHK